MREAVELLLSPLSWLIVALLGLLVVRGAGRISRALQVLLRTVVLVSIALMTPAAANVLTGWLERDALRQEPCEANASTIVALAAGTDRRPVDARDFTALDMASRRRMDVAVELMRNGARRLVIAGGPSRPGAIPTATLMAAYARWAGVSDSRIDVESSSLDTWQNARQVAAMSLPDDIVLVSSAAHLPRAVLAFRSAGFDPCAAPADFRTVSFRLPGALLPRGSALDKSHAALHELAGRAYYHLRGTGPNEKPASP